MERKKIFQKKKKKKLSKIVKNINLEGAYFLNPEYISKVKMFFYFNDEKDKEILNDYIQFVSSKEIEKVIIHELIHALGKFTLCFNINDCILTKIERKFA